jgi:hypothetical protein
MRTLTASTSVSSGPSGIPSAYVASNRSIMRSRSSPRIARPCLREGRAMQHSISYQTPERPTPTEPTVTVSRLRTVTGYRFPLGSS